MLRSHRLFTNSAAAPASATAKASTRDRDGKSSGTDPYTNLAFEDKLLRQTDTQSYVLYLWRNRPTVVIGRNQNPWKECDLELMRQRDVWLARRTSGGGAVYHDLGNTNYTVIMPRDAFTRDRCAQMVAQALQHADIPAHVTARHDVAVGTRKVSGSAFKLTGSRAFHHGTMLIDTDLARLSGCLRSRHAAAIDARGVDSVRSPVANLRDYSLAIDHATFCDAVRRQFAATFGAVHDVTADTDFDDALRTRIGEWDWLYGQTPDFVHRFDAHFAWASVSVSISARRGRITAADIAPAPEAVRPPPHVSAAFADISRLLSGTRYVRADVAERLLPLRTSFHAVELSYSICTLMAIDASLADAECFAAKVHPAAASGPYSFWPLARSPSATHGSTSAGVGVNVDVTRVHPASVCLAPKLQPQTQSNHGFVITRRAQLRPKL
ncbi:hypothetical protein H4S08_001197 [Coemansia sp. RSA 1365]|nr:hypothetical protein H4S08_001197 [Coemansia sp. RSA 1365]